MNSNSIIDELYNLGFWTMKLGCENIQNFLKQIDNPQNKFLSIHVAGTNGKGSICAILTSILRESGYKVGTYTSPHISSFNERICVNNKQISNLEIEKIYNLFKQDALSKNLSFFEFTTAMAFYKFAEDKIDIGIIEVGMGGKFDATNVISPLISIISNIAVDHKKYLGSNLKKIAHDKAGIIKDKTPIISGAKNKEIRKILQDRTQEKRGKIYFLGYDFKRRKLKTGFNYYGLKKNLKNLDLNLAGKHQLDNAAVSLCACEILSNKYKFKISLEKIKEALLEVFWPGRFEVFSKKPLIILDGAHNFASIKALTSTLKENFQDKKKIFIFSCLKDKNFNTMLKELLSIADHLILTQIDNERGISAYSIYKSVKDKKNIKIFAKIKDAKNYAYSLCDKNSMICVTGSLYLIGEFKDKFFLK